MEGFGKEIPKGYIYFAMAFSLFGRYYSNENNQKSEPVHLHEHYKEEEQHLDKDVLQNKKHSENSECFFMNLKFLILFSSLNFHTPIDKNHQ